MSTQFLTRAAFVLVLLLAPAARAEAPKKNAEEEKALKARLQQFIEAFNKGDAVALAAFWTEDGDYVDQVGRQRKGRKAIEETYRKLFAAKKGAKLGITVISLKFVKPECAVEDGITEVFPADGGPPSTARYTLVHVKQGGKWLVDSVREMVAAPPSNHEHLEDLDWLVGEWAQDTDKPEAAKVAYSWSQNQNFLVASFGTTLKDVPVGGGVQWIGWDPAGKHVRSWSFDSTGGFSEGAWSREGDRWTVTTTATLREGQKVSSTNIVTKVDDDHFTWQSVKRSMDGKEMPDSPVIKLKRVKG